MTKIKQIFCFFAIVFMLLPASISVAQEQKEISSLERGIGQFKHENYEEALPLLQQARNEDPGSTLAAYYLGLTYKQLQDYKGAIPHLRDAVSRPPKIVGALIELIDSLYQVGELDQAMTWISEAKKEGIRPAQISFLEGLILLKQENNPQAIDAFKRAKSLDKTMEQSCDYQIGIAHLKAREFNYAKDAFNEVIVREPLSSIAKYANEYLDALARREGAARKWRASFGFAWQYDDNVILAPDETTSNIDISNKADYREVYTADLEYNRKAGERLGLKGEYLFYYGKQNDLGFYNTMSHSVVMQPSLNFERSLLTFPATYTHTLVNERSYLSNPAVSSIYNFMFGDNQMGQAFLQYNNRNYLWTPSMPSEDRDGNELRGGLGWYIFFRQKKAFFNLRYEANHDWTEGDNWEYGGNRITAAVSTPVIDKLKLTLSASSFLQNFSNKHSVFNLERKDTVYTMSSLIAYEFRKGCELQAQYIHVKDDSNINVYTYNRNISSIGLQCKF